MYCTHAHMNPVLLADETTGAVTSSAPLPVTEMMRAGGGITSRFKLRGLWNGNTKIIKF